MRDVTNDRASIRNSAKSGSLSTGPCELVMDRDTLSTSPILTAKLFGERTAKKEHKEERESPVKRVAFSFVCMCLYHIKEKGSLMERISNQSSDVYLSGGQTSSRQYKGEKADGPSLFRRCCYVPSFSFGPFTHLHLLSSSSFLPFIPTDS